jgi:hypothetical protein
METIPARINTIKTELFDVVGLAMGSGGASKQVQSAAAKRWDHLDPEATLRDMATRLEAGEKALIGHSKQLDTGFQEYEPAYSRRFDIEDVKELSESLTALSMLPLPDEAYKELQKAGVRVLGKIVPISGERNSFLMEEIDAGDPALNAIAGTGSTEPEGNG